MIPLSFFLSIAQVPSPDEFDLSHATPFLSEVAKGSVADRMCSSIRQFGSQQTFVAEDGSAVALWSGTVSKIDAKTGEALTDNDQYRFEIRNGILTAFNVSQETYIRKGYGGAKTLSLKPVILLDRFRTLCVNGPQAISANRNDEDLKHTLFLAIIDDRQRGPHPNKLKPVKMPIDMNSSQISVIGTSSEKAILSIFSNGQTRYLTVDLNTLATRWTKPPKWTGFGSDRKAIMKINPQFYSAAEVRWKSKSYFFAPTNKPPFGSGFVWDGKNLRDTGQFFLASASKNGLYAWLIDRQTGSQWLLRS